MLVFAALACGFVFGAGLVVSEMVDPAKVLAFLDVAGPWDPTLGLVFFSALAVAVPGFQWTLRHLEKPLLDDDFHVPGSRAITPSLVGGSAIFGAGWGLAGFCPGPGLTALATLLPGAVAFVAAMFVGVLVYRLLAPDA